MKKKWMNMFKKVLGTLVWSIIIFFIGMIVSLILEIIRLVCPTLLWIIGVAAFLWAGHLFGNRFE